MGLVCQSVCLCFFFFKQKTAYEMRISDWSSDVCSSDLTDPAATAIKTLLVSNRDSREMRSNRPPNPILGARSAYRNNEVPTTTVNSSKMNTPLRGSVAKACTEVSTPERTRNAPSNESENDRKSTRLNSSH